MDVRKYLNHLNVLNLAIRNLTEEIEAMYADMTSPGAIRYDKINVQTSPRDLMAEKEAEIEEKRKKLAKERARYQKLRQRIVDQILNLDDGTQSEVLYRYYVMHQSIRKIAFEMHYNERSIKRIKSVGYKAYDQKYEIWKISTF